MASKEVITDITNLKQDVITLQTNEGNNDTIITELINDVSVLEVDVDTLQTDVDTLQTDVNTLGTTVAANSGTLQLTVLPRINNVNGINELVETDGNGKIASSLLPGSIMEYKGNWSPGLNIPTLADGTGSAGDIYQCSSNGTIDLGSGSITFNTGDWVVYNGSTWEKSIHIGYSKSEIDAKFLPFVGGTMSGNLNMGNNTITNATSVTASEIKSDIYSSTSGTVLLDVFNDGTDKLRPRTDMFIPSVRTLEGGFTIDCGNISCTSLNTQNNNVIMGTGDLTCDTIGCGAVTATSLNTQNGNITMGTGDLTCDTIGCGAVTATSLNTQHGNITMGTGDLACDTIECSSIGSTSTQKIFLTGNDVDITEAVNMNSNPIYGATNITASGTMTCAEMQCTGYVWAGDGLARGFGDVVFNTSTLGEMTMQETLNMNTQNITNCGTLNGQNVLKKYTDTLTGDGTSKTLTITLDTGHDMVSCLLTKDGTADYTYLPNQSGTTVSVTALFPAGSWKMLIIGN